MGQPVNMRASTRRPRTASLLARTLLIGAGVALTATALADSPEQDCADPPSSARPRAWWHWMNGNVRKDGIAKDLAWMQRAGLGGMQNFDANLGTRRIVDKRLVYMAPEWKDAFRYAAGLAQESGLELAIAASPG